MEQSHLVSAASRAVGIEGWEPCIFEAVANGSLLRGAVPTTAKNGKKKWPAQKHMQVVAVTDADVVAEYTRYEDETGNCGDCYGKGRRVVGWHYLDGDRLAHCNKCNGTGTAVRP